jgi:hypothetical protein
MSIAPAIYSLPYPGSPAQSDDIKGSGFTTGIAWALHVQSNGDLHYNDTPIVSGGNYVGDSSWPGFLNGLKDGSVNRILFSIGGWGVGDFPNIQALINQYGTGPGNPLYQNLAALRAAIPSIDGFDYDDETLYDQTTDVQLSQMIAAVGYTQVTFCPYDNMSFWVDCLAALEATNPGLVTGFNLQAYAGGAGNNPQTWIDAIAAKMGPGFDAAGFVFPGLWCCNQSQCTGGDPNSACPGSIQSFFAGWKSTGIQGGFIWNYGDIQTWLNQTNCSPQPTTAAYANAILQGLS